MEKRFTRDSKQKIQSIFTSFQGLVNEIGYNKLTTRLIAEKAQISVGTIYHYFREGKASIAAGLYERNIIETLDIHKMMGYSYDELKTQVTKHLQLHTENKELYRAFDQAIYSNNDIFTGIKRKRAHILSEQLGENVSPGISDIMRVYITVDSIIHRHLFVEPLFESEDELIEYLTILAEAAYEYSQNYDKKLEK